MKSLTYILLIGALMECSNAYEKVLKKPINIRDVDHGDAMAAREDYTGNMDKGNQQRLNDAVDAAVKRHFSRLADDAIDAVERHFSLLADKSGLLSLFRTDKQKRSTSGLFDAATKYLAKLEAQIKEKSRCELGSYDFGSLSGNTLSTHSVTFSKAFKAPPQVVVAVYAAGRGSGGLALHFHAGSGSITTSGFVLSGFNAGVGTNPAASHMQVSWVACSK